MASVGFTQEFLEDLACKILAGRRPPLDVHPGAALWYAPSLLPSGATADTEFSCFAANTPVLRRLTWFICIYGLPKAYSNTHAQRFEVSLPERYLGEAFEVPLRHVRLRESLIPVSYLGEALP